jgi:hypothetical protein
MSEIKNRQLFEEGLDGFWRAFIGPTYSPYLFLPIVVSTPELFDYFNVDTVEECKKVFEFSEDRLEHFVDLSQKIKDLLKHYTEKAMTICIILCRGREGMAGTEPQALLGLSREMALEVVKCDLDRFYATTEGLSLEEKAEIMKKWLGFGPYTLRQILAEAEQLYYN